VENWRYSRIGRLGPGRTIDLNMVVLPAFDQRTKPSRYSISLAGWARLRPVAQYLCYRRQYRRQHDIVLVDQRTGQSNPLTAKPVRKTPQDYLGNVSGGP
jgi:hypothetical protein